MRQPVTACHVSQAPNTHTLDGSNTLLGTTIDRAASVAVEPMAVSSLPPADPVDADHVGGRAAHTEPGDADYAREVFGRTDGATEEDIEKELVAKASALGMKLPLSAKPSTQVPTAHPGDSQETLALPAGRAASAWTNETAVSRPASHTSQQSGSRPATSTASTQGRTESRSLSFSQYDKYLSQVDPALDQPKLVRPNPTRTARPAGIVARPDTKTGVKSFTRSIANKLRRRRAAPPAQTLKPCICCREDFTSDNDALQTLLCGHAYCRDCLGVMVAQSMADESRMPPRCCTQPIPSAIIKLVLAPDMQQLFLKQVVQHSTPWEARIFCPSAACGEFIPPVDALDPKHPFEAVCRSCSTAVCIMCKRAAHPLGQDCPEDRDLDSVLRMGEQSGWRRCYKCRMLVELAQGCTHITCRCKAQFCYICGAVWDHAVGCPNFCNGEEELERRRAEEDARDAEREAETRALQKAEAAEETARLEASRNTAASSEFAALRAQQAAEMARFRGYEAKAMDALRARQSQRREALEARLADLDDKMRDRHAKTEQHLDDRQILAELELQSVLEDKEKKVRLKLRYMEDYCHGTGPEEARHEARAMPPRQVTARDLEQLRQQYCVRDGMERRHQSQINGLREKQAKKMQELVDRHQAEMDALDDRKIEEMEDLAAELAADEDALLARIAQRQARLEKRWDLMAEVLRVEMERREGKTFAKVEAPKWPVAPEAAADVRLDYWAAAVVEQAMVDADVGVAK